MLKPTPLLLFLPLIASAEFTFQEGGSTFSQDSICSTTYYRPLPCSPDLLSLIDNTTDNSIRFSPPLLESSCTNECYNALVQWTNDIRKDCANETAEASYIRSRSKVFTMEEVLDPEAQWLETAWFDTCLTDLTLPGSHYCKTYNDTTKALTWLYNPNLMSSLNNTAAFCNSSCAVQTSIYLHETSHKPNVLDPRQVCPDLDTQHFPFPESWKHRNNPGWQEGGEGGRGVDGPLLSNSTTGCQTGGEGGRPGTNESSTNSTGWQSGGEGGRPSMNESTGNSTGWYNGGEGGRGLNGSLANDTQDDLAEASGGAGIRVSLLAVVIVIGAMAVGL